MIRRRLMAAESQFAYLIFEQNDNVNQEAVRKTVADAYDSLKKSNNRRPKACSIDFVGKPSLGVSVPDFLLGVLGKYLKSGPDQKSDPPARDKLLFERIRDKYRLILDVDSRTEYSRRRPIAPW
jgi:RNA-directed DNA polymerase